MSINFTRLAYSFIKILFFYPFEVVGRGSETQLQMGEKFQLYNVALNL